MPVGQFEALLQICKFCFLSNKTTSPATLCHMPFCFKDCFFNNLHLICQTLGAERQLMSLSANVGDAVAVGDMTSVLYNHHDLMIPLLAL